MSTSSSIDTLIAELAKLPGVGPRSARRLALNLLRQREQRIPALIQALGAALAQVRTCSTCGALDEHDPCRICTDDRRDNGSILIVEDVADVWAMERSRAFSGRYHVLGGTLSAMDGRGPEALRIEPLLARVATGECREIILALSATVAGQTTAHYVAERLNALSLPAETDALKAAAGITITRLAQGIPMGGELDYMDDGTLGAALSARVAY
ncbi:MAG: recombination mediator RecR [Alphaproteobacteria bacterium]|nr:recombination mediator RecR [Alphaproteobacteria bacterium]